MNQNNINIYKYDKLIHTKLSFSLHSIVIVIYKVFEYGTGFDRGDRVDSEWYPGLSILLLFSKAI